MISLLIRKAREKKKPSSTRLEPTCAHYTSVNNRQSYPMSSLSSTTRPNTQASGEQEPLQLTSSGKCVACKDERRTARKYRWKIILGLIFPFALQALDTTIIASALPWIASDFNKISELNWIISAFNLTSAAFIPFWGQIADIFGRHASIQACIIIMMVGSALCTGAPTDSFAVLLLGRGFQGLGAAGLNVIVRIILADKVSLKENAKNWSIFTFVAGSSYGVGPVIGGYLTNTNWRWCFGINLPICAAAIIAIFLILRKELLGPQPLPHIDEAVHTGEQGHLAHFPTRISIIDIGGQLLFLFGFGLIILALTWAGADYDWNTAAVLVPLILGAVLICIFVYWERLMGAGRLLNRKWPRQQPMLPWKLITNRNIGLLFYINFATGAAMYAVLYFVNLFFTLVKGYAADKAGVQLLYYTPGLAVGVYISMFMCNAWPAKTWYPIMLGSVIEAVGVGILAYGIWTEKTATIYGMMALTGAGTAMRFMPGPLHAVGFFPQHIATVVSLMAVAIPFGGTLALTIMATVFNNASGIGPDSPLRDFQNIVSLSRDEQLFWIHKAKMGLVWAFVAITPFMVLCIIAAAFLGNVVITKEKAGKDGYGDKVQEDIYILSLLRGNKRRTVDMESEGKFDTQHNDEPRR